MDDTGYTIRLESPKDYRTVEEITRHEFWNVNVPGCLEHYLVHKMRNHEAFIQQLAFVIEKDEEIIGNIMYTKSKLVDENGNEKEILTFGPISILPLYQRKGYGKALIEHSFKAAKKLGYDTIVIFGNPNNYVGRGFKSCKKYNICIGDGVFPTAMLVKLLKEDALDGRRWNFHESNFAEVNDKDEAFKVYDETFTHKEKCFKVSQEEFYILSQSIIA